MNKGIQLLSPSASFEDICNKLIEVKESKNTNKVELIDILTSKGSKLTENSNISEILNELKINFHYYRKDIIYDNGKYIDEFNILKKLDSENKCSISNSSNSVTILTRARDYDRRSNATTIVSSTLIKNIGQFKYLKIYGKSSCLGCNMTIGLAATNNDEIFIDGKTINIDGTSAEVSNNKLILDISDMESFYLKIVSKMTGTNDDREGRNIWNKIVLVDSENIGDEYE